MSRLDAASVLYLTEITHVNGCMYLRLFMANFQVSDCFVLFQLILYCGKCEKSVSMLVCTSGAGGGVGSPAPQEPLLDMSLGVEVAILVLRSPKVTT